MWDKNDSYTAALIIILLVVGSVIGIYGLGLMPNDGRVEMRWESPQANSTESEPQNGTFSSSPLPNPPLPDPVMEPLISCNPPGAD